MRNLFKRARSKRNQERQPLERRRQHERISEAAASIQNIRDLTTLVAKQSALLKARALEQQEIQEQLCMTLDKISDECNAVRTPDGKPYFDPMFFTQFQESQGILSHLNYSVAKTTVHYFEKNLRMTEEHSATCDSLLKSLKGAVHSQHDLKEIVNQLSTNKHRDRATKKLLNAQQELLSMNRKVEVLQAKLQHATDSMVTEFTRSSITGMVDLLKHQQRCFSHMHTITKNTESVRAEVEDSLELFSSAAESRQQAKQEELSTLDRLMRHANGTADFETICRGMIPPKEPLLLDGEGTVKRIQNVLWLPICLESGGISAVPGHLIVTTYRFIFTPYNLPSQSPVDSSVASSEANSKQTTSRSSMLSHFRRRESAVGGIGKYGRHILDINTFKLEQRKALSACIRNSFQSDGGIESEGKGDNEDIVEEVGDVAYTGKNSSARNHDLEQDPDYTPVFEEFDGTLNAFHLPLASISRIESISEEKGLMAVWTETLQSFMMDVTHSPQLPASTKGDSSRVEDLLLEVRPFLFAREAIFAHYYKPKHLAHLKKLSSKRGQLKGARGRKRNVLDRKSMMLQMRETRDNKGQQSGLAAIAEARRRVSSTSRIAESLLNSQNVKKRPLSRQESIRLADGWKIYDHQAEFNRIGIQASIAWRVSTLNFEYQVCDSYPRLLGVPSSMHNDDLVKAAGFRSKSRMIALVWRRGAVPWRRDETDKQSKNMKLLSADASDVALVRCAQPLVGLTGSTSSKDENILGLLAKTSLPRRKDGVVKRVAMLYDARPHISATANLARGGGYERMSQYKDCELEFLGIQNIHAVREAFVRLHGMFSNVQSSNRHQELAHAHVEAQLRESNNTGRMILGGDDGMSPGNEGGSGGPGTGNALNTSNMTWFHHLVDVLNGGVKVANCIDGGTSALVHCSDGWDRTAQVCALAQLFLDPYFRTLRGFQVLIEKEWLSFGHKFAERCGHDTSSKKSREDYLDKQRSPVFVQFLDCVWQIMKQFPRYFEFNDLLLSAAMRHVYSARYGTFLFNTERERMMNSLASGTISLWTEINVLPDPFLNETYDPETATAEMSTRLMQRMQMEVQLLSLWPAYELLWRQGHVNSASGQKEKTTDSSTAQPTLQVTRAVTESKSADMPPPALPPRSMQQPSIKKVAPPIPERSERIAEQSPDGVTPERSVKPDGGLSKKESGSTSSTEAGIGIESTGIRKKPPRPKTKAPPARENSAVPPANTTSNGADAWDVA